MKSQRHASKIINLLIREEYGWKSFPNIWTWKVGDYFALPPCNSTQKPISEQGVLREHQNVWPWRWFDPPMLADSPVSCKHKPLVSLICHWLFFPKTCEYTLPWIVSSSTYSRKKRKKYQVEFCMIACVDSESHAFSHIDRRNFQVRPKWGTTLVFYTLFSSSYN